MPIIKFILGVTLSCVAVFEALAIFSLLSAIATNSIQSSEHLTVAIGTTIDLFILFLSGYWALRFFGVIKKRAN